MKKRDLTFIAVILLVVAFFITLSLISRKPPMMTTRAEHSGLGAHTPREICLGCHGPDGGIAPLKPRHPKKGKLPDQTGCFVCHKPVTGS